MIPIVPSSLIPSIGGFKDKICYWSPNGNVKKSFSCGQRSISCCDLSLSSAISGSEDDVKYSICFEDVRSSWMSKVYVKAMEAEFKAKDGSTISKRIENQMVEQSQPTVEFVITKEEIKSFFAGKSSEWLNVRIAVEIQNTCGIRHRKCARYTFTEKNSKSTLAILFDDERKYFVNLSFVSTFSAFFDKLSDHVEDLAKDEESELRLLVLKEFESSAFLDILYMIYPHNQQKTRQWQNPAETLRLADFLCFETILQEAEMRLAADSTNLVGSQAQKLLWSVNYSMPILQNAVISSIRFRNQVHSILKDPLYCELPKEVLQMLLKRMMTITSEGDTDDEVADEAEGTATDEVDSDTSSDFD